MPACQNRPIGRAAKSPWRVRGLILALLPPFDIKVVGLHRAFVFNGCAQS